jgi:hypothetical protein
MENLGRDLELNSDKAFSGGPNFDKKNDAE